MFNIICLILFLKLLTNLFYSKLMSIVSSIVLNFLKTLFQVNLHVQPWFTVSPPLTIPLFSDEKDH